MNFLDVLNTATANLSDNKLSKKLGIGRTTVSAWRNRGTIPEDEVLDKLAEITGIPAEKVYFASYADKVHSPMFSALLRGYSEFKIVADKTQIDNDLHNSWQKELSDVITDPKILLDYLKISPKNYLQHFKARQLFPVRVPKSFIQRMKKSDINDPLLKQVMPSSQEFVAVDGYSIDPLFEHNTIAKGLIHKYKNRVLMIIKSGCAINCRYCFRRHFPYQDNSPNKIHWQDALLYITKHDEVSEVIFSGGDPLMASDEHLAWLIEQLEKISHIKRLRIHTR